MYKLSLLYLYFVSKIIPIIWVVVVVKLYVFVLFYSELDNPKSRIENIHFGNLISDPFGMIVFSKRFKILGACCSVF